MILQKIYNLLTNIYSFLISSYENIILKNNNINNDQNFIRNGFQILNLNNQISYNFDKIEKMSVNNYMSKDILTKKQIYSVIKNLFILSNLKEKITEITGFKYNIDFTISYETSPIPELEKSKHWYANHWHYDKPFSKNTLKIIVPLLNKIDEKDGGIEIVDKFNSRKKKLNSSFPNYYRMIADVDKALIFLPNICLHRAGSPCNRPRKQIMFQLNPSNDWKLNLNIQNKQKKVEPKFPFFSYFFDKYEKLDDITI